MTAKGSGSLALTPEAPVSQRRLPTTANDLVMPFTRMPTGTRVAGRPSGA